MVPLWILTFTAAVDVVLRRVTYDAMPADWLNLAEVLATPEGREPSVNADVSPANNQTKN